MLNNTLLYTFVHKSKELNYSERVSDCCLMPTQQSLYKLILLLLINVLFDQIGKKNLCNRVVCDNDIKFILYI
jgi:hypothetical protein